MALKVKNVTKHFGNNTALNGISFEINCGDSVSLIGPNGAGKTTTLRILSGILRPDSGTVKICGVDIFKKPREAKTCLGYLPEDAVPFLNLTVRENLEYVGILRGIDGLDDRIDELVKVLELEDLMNKPVAALSRGNRQKVALAMAIIHRPKVLLLDEPLNYLDIPTQERIIKLLRNMNNDGTTILLSTHIMSIAEKLTNDAIIINRGKIIWRGTMEQLKTETNANQTIEETIINILNKQTPTQ
nr:MAG: multidrug ABC transporter ATP-binding protein [Vulcanisaeta sp. AZ3]